MSTFVATSVISNLPDEWTSTVRKSAGDTDVATAAHPGTTLEHIVDEYGQRDQESGYVYMTAEDVERLGLSLNGSAVIDDAPVTITAIKSVASMRRVNYYRMT